jgi:hypothetical protein
MILFLLIWGILFGIFLLLFIRFSKSAFKKLTNAEIEKNQWRLMGDRTNYYRLAVLISLLLSLCIAYLIKILFNF